MSAKESIRCIKDGVVLMLGREHVGRARSGNNTHGKRVLRGDEESRGRVRHHVSRHGPPSCHRRAAIAVCHWAVPPKFSSVSVHVRPRSSAAVASVSNPGRCGCNQGRFATPCLDPRSVTVPLQCSQREISERTAAVAALDCPENWAAENLGCPENGMPRKTAAHSVLLGSLRCTDGRLGSRLTNEPLDR